MTDSQRTRLQNAYILAVADMYSFDMDLEVLFEPEEIGENTSVLGVTAQLIRDAMSGKVSRFTEMTDDELLARCEEQCGYDYTIDYSLSRIRSLLGDYDDLRYQTALGAVIQEIKKETNK